MATITITYTAITAPANEVGAQICAMYLPTNAAADLAPFDGTYYDTNVEGFGEAMSLEKFYADSVAHPGLVLALKRAVADGEYEFETEDAKEIAYFEEVANAVASQGFTITVTTE
jgi:hypothetical protein